MKRYYAVVKRTKPSDELRHWKYVKREKKNGKWVYYYNEDLKSKSGLNTRADLKEAENNREMYEDVRDSAIRQGFDNERIESYHKSAKEYESIANELREQYYSTPLGSIEKYVDKGKKIFNKNLFQLCNFIKFRKRCNFFCGLFCEKWQKSLLRGGCLCAIFTERKLL